MKRILVFFTIASMLTFAACGDDESEIIEEPTGSTETTAEFDNSGFGLYKGVIVGSSGTIKIEINNGNDVTKAFISIDNKTDELTCISTLIKGQAITNATFNGTFTSFKFSVDADGKNPTVSDITIEGHNNISATIFKETSNNVASGYEGTTIGGNNHSGVLNVVRNNDTFSAISKGNDGIVFNYKGVISANGSFTGQSSAVYNNTNVKITVSGSFKGNQLEGTWKTEWGSGTNSGTFSGKKTL